MKNKVLFFCLLCFITISHLQRDYNVAIFNSTPTVLSKTFKNSIANYSLSFLKPVSPYFIPVLKTNF
jgi:hypothetical protein